MSGTVFVVAVVLCLSFTFTNGMKDGCNVFATAVSSGSLPFGRALLIVALAELAGPFLFGIPVALTVARGIIKVEILPRSLDSQLLILSGVAGAILWNVVTWAAKLPTSSSFALVGGLIGPVLYRYGVEGVPWVVFLLKVVGAMLLSPLLGIGFGMLVYRLLRRALHRATWRANDCLKTAQIFSLILLGMNHGTNDSQKTMGLIALLLFLSGRAAQVGVPFWVMLVSIASLVAGITMGGTRIIKTVGYGIFRMRPVHSFASQVSSSLVLLGSNLLGAPVSTTQIISSSVIGVGNAHRRGNVRWRVILNIFLSWLFTIPAAGAVAWGIYLLLSRVL
jgi:PiT family inorganic phosphate transporter